MKWNIIIATWNRSTLLGRTLESLASLRTPPGVEWDVTVADNHSTDDTAAVVERAQSRFDGRLRYLYEARQGKSHALNAALADTRGDWLLFLDDDVLVESDLIETYTAGAQGHENAGCLAGGILPDLEKPPSPRQRWLLREYPQLCGHLVVETDRPMTENDTGWGANMAIRRSAMPEGGFALDRGMFAGRRVAGEDIQIQLDILRAGHEGWLLRGADARHHTPLDRISLAALGEMQLGIGRHWRIERGAPTPGRWGKPWWAYRALAGRWLTVRLAWRPWLTRTYCDRVLAYYQYLGYVRG